MTTKTEAAKAVKRAPRPKAPSATETHEVLGLTEREKEISKALWHSLVPEPAWYDTYEGRNIRGFADLDVLAQARLSKKNVLVQGPTGAGKSYAFRAFGAKEGTAVATIDCNGASDPSLWWGDYRYIHGEWVWVDGIATVVARYGGVIYANEINFLRPEISAALHLLFREREIRLERKGNEIVRLADDCLLVGDYNAGYAGTAELNEAVKNRFAIHVGWDYDRDVETKLVNNEVLLDVAQALRKLYAEGELETPVSTNALQDIEDFAVAFDLEFALQNFVERFRPEERVIVTETLDVYSVRGVFEDPLDEEV